MIKGFIKILIVLFTFISITTVAQDSEKIDVRALVKAQMLKAQGGAPVITKKSMVERNNGIFPKLSTTLFNLLIFLLGSILILSLVYLRRVKIQEQIISKQFKENIRLIREEKLIQPIDHTLTPVRKGLLEKIEVCLEEQTITTLARKLNIAKGEILLVNNIKNYGSVSTMAGNQA